MTLVAEGLIIITHGSCLFGGCMYNLDTVVGVIPVLVFPICILETICI